LIIDFLSLRLLTNRITEESSKFNGGYPPCPEVMASDTNVNSYAEVD
jgi:hypothetical protein